ncbi:MAG: hypothetical protein ACREJ2_03210, partial [Planctomycetota bacterium]
DSRVYDRYVAKLRAEIAAEREPIDRAVAQAGPEITSPDQLGPDTPWFETGDMALQDYAQMKLNERNGTA